MSDIAIVVAFALWLVVCVARQTGGPLARRIGQLDVLRLSPNWRLFSNPTRWDLRLLIRYRQDDGALTPWQPVLESDPRPSQASLWHPQLVPRLMAMEIANAAVALHSPGARSQALASPKYRGFVSWLLDTAPSGAAAVQFLVVAERSFDTAFPRTTVHLSDVHERVTR